jgi:hypothetical protein
MAIIYHQVPFAYAEEVGSARVMNVVSKAGNKGCRLSSRQGKRASRGYGRNRIRQLKLSRARHRHRYVGRVNYAVLNSARGLYDPPVFNKESSAARGRMIFNQGVIIA